MIVADGKYDDNRDIAELQVQLEVLQNENVEIKQALREIANANVLPGILQNGFDSVMAELRPLRDLAPQREPLPRPVADAVAAMLTAMQGVRLPSGSLGIPEVSVPFFGHPDRPRPPAQGATLPGAAGSDPYQTRGTPNQQILGGGLRS